MQISAIIPTKNRISDLLAAVQSITLQTRLPEELIIVDQSDTDTGRALVSNLTDKAGSNVRLIYIYDPKITGLVDAKRVGVAHSGGDVVCFLEDDIILEAGYLEAMSTAFESQPGMKGCCGVVTNLPDLPKYYVRLFHLFHRGIFHDARVGVHGNTLNSNGELLPSIFLSGGTSAYRREVFDKVRFDLENGFFMLEDIDFSTRAARAFGKDHFFINTSAKLAHMMSPVNRARLLPRYQRKLREFICFYKKNRDADGCATLSLFWLLFGLFLEALFVSVKLRSVAPLLGTLKGVADGVAWKVVK